MFARKKVTRIHVYVNKIPSIVLLSILIHLFANTIQNIVIHVIHLSTQILRFFSTSFSPLILFIYFLYSALWRSLAYNTFAMA